MGYDTSFHPVPGNLVSGAIIPYMLGEDIDVQELINAAVYLQQIRFIAFRWSIAASHAVEDVGPTHFDSQLHTWGRPYFITVEEPGEIPKWIVAYQEATNLEQINAVANEMLRHLHPSLPGRVVPTGLEEGLSYADWEHDARWKLDFVRAASLGLRGKGPEMIQAPSGDVLPAQEIVETYFLQSAIDFSSHFVPGWYHRGRAWPSTIFDEHGLPSHPTLTDPSVLWTAVHQAIEGVNPIQGEFFVDDFVRFDGVRDFRAHAKAQGEKLLATTEDPDEQSHYRLMFKKLDECLCCAELGKHSFATGQDIYSGPLGLFN